MGTSCWTEPQRRTSRGGRRKIWEGSCSRATTSRSSRRRMVRRRRVRSESRCLYKDSCQDGISCGMNVNVSSSPKKVLKIKHRILILHRTINKNFNFILVSPPVLLSLDSLVHFVTYGKPIGVLPKI